ncbi:hypothetical protein [Teredinibacter purpureus]|uniref:hypothetical protein n=1 Tax=Teredinibacter purpureus TaxID=2731756 RepID=UPI0005F85D6D|nr:hypothetical protein [Teredinibacter purpureus]
MNKQKKLWIGVSAITFAGLATLNGCSSETQSDAREVNGAGYTSPNMIIADEGEGEGASDAAGLETDDLAYLTQLGLMRGHLYVGYSLYQADHVEHAKTHMKHPKSELYAAIEPAFAARGVAGFATELQRLASLVGAGAEKSIVAHAYNELMEAIGHAEQGVNTQAQTSAMQLKRVVELLRVAGEEYAIAVVDGQLSNAHEYQDALGFTTIAKQLIASGRTQEGDAGEASAKAARIIDELAAMWPSLIPPLTLDTDAGALYGAAAKIELLANGL